LLYKEFEINCMTLYIPCDYFFLNAVYTFDKVSLKGSKWHLHSIQII
jgi:hypothetical protein